MDRVSMTCTWLSNAFQSQSLVENADLKQFVGQVWVGVGVAPALRFDRLRLAQTMATRSDLVSRELGRELGILQERRVPFRTSRIARLQWLWIKYR